MHGQTIRDRAVEAGLLSETRHVAAVLPRHHHELPSFCLVMQGRFRESNDRTMATFARNDVIYRRSGEVHTNTFESDTTRCFNVLFHPELLVRAGSTEPDLRPAKPILRQLLVAMRARRGALTLEGLLLQLIGDVFQPAATAPSLVSETLRIVHERFTEPLTIRAIAAELATHPVHLSRTFRREQGQSIAGVIRELRIQRAADLLRDERLTLAEIAARSGFSDQSHFTRAFRAARGCTPGRERAITVLSPSPLPRTS